MDVLKPNVQCLSKLALTYFAMYMWVHTRSHSNRILVVKLFSRWLNPHTHMFWMEGVFSHKREIHRFLGVVSGYRWFSCQRVLHFYYVFNVYVCLSLWNKSKWVHKSVKSFVFVCMQQIFMNFVVKKKRKSFYYSAWKNASANNPDAVHFSLR